MYAPAQLDWYKTDSAAAAGVGTVSGGYGPVRRQGMRGLDPDDMLRPAPPPSVPVHANVKCSSCEFAPIRGSRYVCTLCPNFNMCENCERLGYHSPAHPLIKVRDPRAKLPVVFPDPKAHAPLCQSCMDSLKNDAYRTKVEYPRLQMGACEICSAPHLLPHHLRRRCYHCCVKFGICADCPDQKPLGYTLPPAHKKPDIEGLHLFKKENSMTTSLIARGRYRNIRCLKLQRRLNLNKVTLDDLVRIFPNKDVVRKHDVEEFFEYVLKVNHPDFSDHVFRIMTAQSRVAYVSRKSLVSILAIITQARRSEKLNFAFRLFNTDLSKGLSVPEVSSFLHAYFIDSLAVLEAMVRIYPQLFPDDAGPIEEELSSRRLLADMQDKMVQWSGGSDVIEPIVKMMFFDMDTKDAGKIYRKDLVKWILNDPRLSDWMDTVQAHFEINPWDEFPPALCSDCTRDQEGKAPNMTPDEELECEECYGIFFTPFKHCRRLCPKCAIRGDRCQDSRCRRPLDRHLADDKIRLLNIKYPDGHELKFENRLSHMNEVGPNGAHTGLLGLGPTTDSHGLGQSAEAGFNRISGVEHQFCYDCERSRETQRQYSRAVSANCSVCANDFPTYFAFARRICPRCATKTNTCQNAQCSQRLYKDGFAP